MKADQKRQDYQYKRNGVATLFIAFEPLTGQRIVEVLTVEPKPIMHIF